MRPVRARRLDSLEACIACECAFHSSNSDLSTPPRATEVPGGLAEVKAPMVLNTSTPWVAAVLRVQKVLESWAASMNLTHAVSCTSLLYRCSLKSRELLSGALDITEICLFLTAEQVKYKPG